MDVISRFGVDRVPRAASFRKGFYIASSALPLPFMNFVLKRLVKSIGAKRPEIFGRLEGHHHKWFLVDPTDLPFFLCLRPDPACLELRACRKHHAPIAESRISGSFLALLGMIDGRYDGDALFFSRDLRVEGDTEAVVCLRNALDDIDGSIADDVASFVGVPGRKFLKIARRIGAHDHRP